MKRPDVQYAEPIDYGALMAQASAAASQQYRDQMRTMVRFYPKMEELQLGTIDKLAGRLDNDYAQQARGAINDALGQRAMIDAEGRNLSAIGGYVSDRALESYEGSGPTSIESELYRQAEGDLALGRSLSPEQIRQAQQSARAAFAARGMGSSAGGAAAEILNRDAMAGQREGERRNFASGANQMLTQNVMARRDQAANQAALGANLMTGAAGLAGNSANLGLAGSSALVALDPRYRAMAPGLQAAGSTQANMMQGIGQTYGGAMGMAGNVASFNANMLDTRANSAMNNWAAMRGAQMGAGAMNNAGMMGMIGGIGGGLLGGLGASKLLSDKREKKDIKPLGKAASVLGLTAYEYKYKGEDEKRVGFMAQDVKKVLPEAVAEVEYKGKKRLAIKPAVIGAALADELMAAKAA
jgi:hypothetical protein